MKLRKPFSTVLLYLLDPLTWQPFLPSNSLLVELQCLFHSSAYLISLVHKPRKKRSILLQKPKLPEPPVQNVFSKNIFVQKQSKAHMNQNNIKKNKPSKMLYKIHCFTFFTLLKYMFFTFQNTAFFRHVVFFFHTFNSNYYNPSVAQLAIITLHYATLHYTTLPYTTLHYMTWHDITYADTLCRSYPLYNAI